MITSDMVQPIVNAVSNNVTAVVPAGIAVLGLILGVKAVPRILKSFF